MIGFEKGIFFPLNGSFFFTEKDFFPSVLQKFTRFPEVQFCEGTNNSDYIIGYGRALSRFSNCMLMWRKQNIIKILKNS